jgi:hypothetical protein
VARYTNRRVVGCSDYVGHETQCNVSWASIRGIVAELPAICSAARRKAEGRLVGACMLQRDGPVGLWLKSKSPLGEAIRREREEE